MSHNQFPLFNETSIRKLYKERADSIKETIYNEDEGTVLNANKADYVDWIVNEHRIQQPVIDTDEEALIREERTRDRIQKEEFVLCYPVAGNTDLFRYQVSSRRSTNFLSKIEDGLLKIDLNVTTPKQDSVQRKIDRARRYIENHLENLKEDIEDHNQTLEQNAEKWFSNRRVDVEREYDLLDGLDVPVLDRDDVSETFAALNVDRKEKITVEKPDPPDTAEPGANPAIPEGDYRKIVSAINDVGKNFEKNPELFEGKSEEQLRDFVLFYLQPLFEGTASGETFNMTGKSDIMLQYDGDPLLVAECAIWHGKEYYLEKISQLHGYLRWRDSKAAVVLFVRNKAMEPVRETIREKTTEHETVDALMETVDESWYEFQAHVPGDEGREVTLAVLAFNIPPIK